MSIPLATTRLSQLTQEPKSQSSTPASLEMLPQEQSPRLVRRLSALVHKVQLACLDLLARLVLKER